MESLLSEMRSSVNEYDILREKLLQDDWLALFRTATPDDFGSIVAHVRMESDQPRIAALLATPSHDYYFGTPSFGCRYAAAAIRKAADWTRYTMVERLVPCCADIATEHHLIRAELTDWQRTITQHFFDDAIRKQLESSNT